MSGESEVAEWRVFPVAPEKMHSKADGGVEGFLKESVQSSISPWIYRAIF